MRGVRRLLSRPLSYLLRLCRLPPSRLHSLLARVAPPAPFTMQVKHPVHSDIRAYEAVDSIWLGQMINELRACSGADENIFDTFKRIVLCRFHRIGMKQVAMARDTGLSPRAVNYYLERYGMQDKQIRAEQGWQEPHTNHRRPFGTTSKN